MTTMPATDFGLLERDLRRQHDLLAERHPRLRDAAREAAASVRRPSRIFIVGCGDSLNIGMTVRYLWELLLGLPVEAVPAMSFSRWLVRTAPPDALVIALSQSGTVVRVVEAVRAARARGCQTITATANRTSPLGVEPADHTIDTAFPKLGFVPGTTSYTYHLLLFYELGLALAERWDGASAADIRRQLDRTPDLVGATIERTWPVAKAQAGAFATATPFLILGSGPNLGTAHFLARKMFEVPQITALSQESEEYAHDEYSIVTPDTIALVFDGPDSGQKRTAEITGSLLNLGTRTAVVTELGCHVDERVSWAYETEPGLSELLAPLVASIPGQILTYELAVALGGSFYGSAEPTHSSEGDDLIYRSELLA